MGGNNAHAAAHAVLGILGNLASGLFFISSTPTIVRIVRSKSSGGLSGDLYVVKLFNCMLWSLYGLPFVHPHDVWVVLTNVFGCAFSIIYILTYLLFATSKQKICLLWKLCAVISSFTFMVVLLVLLSKSQNQRILVVGSLSTIVSSAMHLTLLSQCRNAIELRDKEFLHPNASLAGFIKGGIWSAYGIVSFDIFILIPNGVGVLIGIVQVILVIFISRSVTPRLSPHECDNENQCGKTSQEINIESSSKGLDQEVLDSSKSGTLSFSKVSKVPSLIGLPRQRSIPSNVIVPIIIDSNTYEKP